MKITLNGAPHEVRATRLSEVLAELGFADVRVYDGSWLEWGDPEGGFPIEQPEFAADGIQAACRLINKGDPRKGDQIRVQLVVANNSGFELRDLVAAELSFAGATIDPPAMPPPRRFLPDKEVAAFEWAFDLDGVVTVGASLSARGPGDQAIAIGPIDCGSASGG
jgi:hypothetical protein